MKPFQVEQREQSKVMKSLVTRIYLLLEQHKHLDAEARSSGSGQYLEKELISTVGLLSLLVPESLWALFQQQLWSHVRITLGAASPSQLHSDDYGDLCRRAIEILSEPAQFRLAARTVPLTDWQMMSKAMRSPVSHPDSDVKPRNKTIDEIMYFFMERLNAGFYLSGIEALWPMQGKEAARDYLKSSALEELDEILTENKEKLNIVQKECKRIVADLPVQLCSSWFKGIHAFLKNESEIKSHNQNSQYGSDYIAGSNEPVVQRMLLQELLETHCAASDCTGTFEVSMEEEYNLILVKNKDHILFAFWFPEHENDTCRLPGALASFVSEIYCASIITVEINESEDEYESSDPPYYMLQLNGFMVSADWDDTERTIRILKPEMFRGAHEKCLQRLIQFTQPEMI